MRNLYVYISGFMSNYPTNLVRTHFEGRAVFVRELGYHPLTPQAETLSSLTTAVVDQDVPIRVAKMYKDKDHFMVQRADIVWFDASLAHPDDKSIGSTYELCWADMYNKIVIVSNINKGMTHGFIKDSATFWCAGREEVRDALVQIKSEMGIS